MPLPCQGGHHVFLTVLALPLLLVPGFMARPGSFAADPANPIRTPWTTSRVVGSPDPRCLLVITGWPDNVLSLQD